MEREKGGPDGAHIVVALNPWNQRAVRAIVPTSEEQSETQASVLDFKPFPFLWRGLGGGSFRIVAPCTWDALSI